MNLFWPEPSEAYKQFYDTAATTNATSSAFGRPGSVWEYHCVITGTGPVSVTATIQVSNDGSNWETFGTMTPSGTTTATDYVGGDAKWRQHRCVLTNISGTGAAANVYANGE